MLSILTSYLLKYKQVCIPNIGTFEIVQQTPLLNFAEKTCYPPAFATEYFEKDHVSEHQLHTIAALHHADAEQIRKQLSEFGEHFRMHIGRQPFYWKGFGTLRRNSETIIFVPAPIDIYSLKPVTADKVMRGTSEHNMLVGDREMTFQEATDVLQQPAEKKKTYSLWIGWVLLALAIMAIIFILYQGGFETSTSGTHWKWI